VTVGVIADEFTALALGYEWRSVPLTPTGWREQVEQTPIDLLFVESAWHGNDDAWRFQVIGSQGPSGHLRDMVTVLRDRGVPTVFWNKEDPAHYDEAIETARLFDWVFTTDEAMVEHYRRDLGHDRIGILPFAAQPAIHNPIRLLDEAGRPAPLRDVAFAGTYFAHKYPERREQMEIVLGGAHDVAARLPHGLDIFSRYLGGDDTYQFPPPWDSHVRGSLTYTQMLSAYRAYAVFFAGFAGFEVAQYADFAFDGHAASVGEVNDGTGGVDVVFIGGRGLAVFEQRAVHHDGGEAQLDGALAHVGRCAVVLVHHDRDVREFFDCGQNQMA